MQPPSETRFSTHRCDDSLLETLFPLDIAMLKSPVWGSIMENVLISQGSEAWRQDVTVSTEKVAKAEAPLS